MTHALVNRLRSLSHLFMVTLGLLLGTSAAAQDTLVAGTWYAVGFDGPGTALSPCAGCQPSTNPSSVAVPAAPWTITVAAGQQLVMVDAWRSGDQFQLFSNGATLGTTSAPTSGGDCGSDLTCAMGDARFSQGSFVLSAGTHTLTGLQVAGEWGAA